MIQQTSLLAYKKLDGILGQRQLYVLDLVRRMPGHTALELAYYDGKDSNFIRPRLTELFEMGLIYIDGRRKSMIKPYRESYTWRSN